MTLTITWVAGATAAGKTAWIRDRIMAIDANDANCLYCAYSTASSDGLSSTIDATYLSYVCPHIQCLPNLPSVGDLLDLSRSFTHLWIEVGSEVDLMSLPELPGELVNRVLIQAENLPVVAGWATSTIVGRAGVMPDSLWQTIDLSGEILDPPSLAMVWTELTQGAYGEVQRAKALFETIDGYPLYFDYVASDPVSGEPADYEELTVDRHLQGRPQRFSGLAVRGEINLTALQQSLKDASLDDQLIGYYQSQIEQMLQQQAVS